MMIDDSGNDLEKAISPSIISYNDDALKSKISIGNPFQLMKYENKEPTKCIVNRCTLKSEGCINDYTGNKISMSPTDFTVSAMVNFEDGYNEKFCIVCGSIYYVPEGNTIYENSGMEVQRDNISVTQ